jgi:hypothetical protein
MLSVLCRFELHAPVVRVWIAMVKRIVQQVIGDFIERGAL